MTNSEKNHEQQTALLVSQGNPAAMKELYCATAEYLTAVCARYISDDEDVKDILQDSYVKIFTSAGKFEYRGEGSLRAWMTRIVVNESLKFLKRTEKSGILQYGDSIPDVADDSEPDVAGIPVARLHEMIRALPAGYRTVFNLYVFEHKSHKEIAAMLGISENTSASQLHRAKDMLAKKIRNYNSADHERTMD